MAFEWTDEAIAQLRELWATNLSSREIGRRFGTSKGSVIGKAHRLNLPARPLPIPRARLDGTTRRAAVVAPRVTLAIAPGPVPEVIVLMPRRSEPCCWVIGHPAGRRTRFCEAPSLPGKPLCPEHAARTYVAKPNRVAANAA